MREDFELRVQRTGAHLYELMSGDIPALFQKRSWAGKVIEQCLKDEEFKVSMFRFIDVLPHLTTPESISKHLKEYFEGFEKNIMEDLGLLSKETSISPGAANRAAKGVKKNLLDMMKQFIVGTTPQEALPVLENLRSRGFAVSVDLLGEEVISEKEVKDNVDRYLEILDLLHEAQKNWKTLEPAENELDWGHGAKINISLKPSSMYSQMYPRAFDYSVSRAKDRMRPIFQKAVETGAHICLDAEQHELKDLALALYRNLLAEPEFAGYPHTGIVIQTYLRDSEHDLRDLVRWAQQRQQRITIRLVKGAYWETEIVGSGQKNWPIPIFLNKQETDANFEKQARVVMENHAWVTLACASHNIRSVAYVMELAKELEVPENYLEYQVLYGMAEPVTKVLQSLGLPVRLYTPIGKVIPGMAYLIRRLLENTSKESYLRQTFAEDLSVEEQLKNPQKGVESMPLAPDDHVDTPQQKHREPFQNEPLWDWSISEQRERFSRALAEVRSQFPYRVPLVINDKNVTTKTQLHSRNPNDPDEVIAIVSSAGRCEAEEAVLVASDSFPAWRDTSPEVRAEFLFQAAEVARKMRYQLAALQVHEVGKAWYEADADVCEAIDFLEYYAREMIRIAVPQPMGHIPGETSYLAYEPRGLTTVLAPWNFPLAISMGMTSAALVTGNTVIFKPSSKSCITGFMVYTIFNQAGLPPGVLNFLPGSGGEIGDFLVSHPYIATIAFTGSKEVGLRVIDLVGKTPEDAIQVKRAITEMGGKNAVIVDADADPEGAIREILHSAFGYQGQKCSACSRAIVLEEIYDRFIERLKNASESVELGPVEKPENLVGAVIDASARDKILHYIELGKREANVLLERSTPGAKGHFVPLVIFSDVQPQHRIAQEEIFGPVLAVLKAKDFDDALRIANNSRYALTGSVFSRSPENIAKAKRSFRVGNLYINRGCTGAVVGRHPFGGFKMSGVGSKSGGPEYLFQFMVPRNVAENTFRRGFAPMRR